MNVTMVLVLATVLVSLAAFGNRTLFYRLALNPYDVARKRQWWRMLTHGFVHADYMHLIVNMFVFWSFGSAVERTLGFLQVSAVWSMLGLYLGGIVVSAVPDLSRHRNDPLYNSIGASGAVSAVLFASIFFNPWGKIYLFGLLPIPSILFGVAYVLYSRYMDRRGGGNVNHLAHLTGAFYGVAYLVLLEPSLLVHFFRSLAAVF